MVQDRTFWLLTLHMSCVEAKNSMQSLLRDFSQCCGILIFGLKTVAAKAATAPTVPTPLHHAGNL